MALHLVIHTPDHKTRRVPLEGESLTVGRARGNDLCYPADASLSRRHLRFSRDAEGWWAEDLKSKNGSRRNRTELARRELLRAGDLFELGHLVIRVVDPDAPSASDVIFEPEAGPELLPGATVMTSLDGLLSGETTSPGSDLQVPVPASDIRGRMFDLPEVKALFRALRELATARPLEELFPLILDLTIQAVGAERAVLMTCEAGTELVTRAVHGEGFRISTKVRDRVLNEKSSLLVKDLSQDEALRQQLSITTQQIHTMMAVPLQNEDRVIGLIYVDSRSPGRGFTSDDLNLLTALANVAAIRIEHQRFADIENRERSRVAELRQAGEIQRRFLPSGAPRVAGVDLAGHNAASRLVGGDYYDFLVAPEGGVNVVLGDVAGKGIGAALLMSNLQAMVQLLAVDSVDLAALMSRLDQSVAKRCPRNRFITLFLGRIEPSLDRLVCCNAGHNPALLVRTDGRVEPLTAGGTMLGVFPELGYEEQTHRFAVGDVLAVYSDGVTEAVDPRGEEFGEERLSRLVAEHRAESADRIVDIVIQAVEEWSDSAPAVDDATLVVARRTGP